MSTIYIETLGCEKNTVDSETIIGILENAGHTFTVSPAEADVIIVNTCAFISDAKKESIDKLFDLTVFRQHGKCKRLIATGCIPQRYRNDLTVAFPEVDAFVGTNRLTDILSAIDTGGFYAVDAPKQYEEYNAPRVHTGGKGSAFVRIADGCFSTCSFCAIPLIRGAYRSRTIENILAEARAFAAIGVKEINLIAQETTYYGQDIYGERSLARLLGELNSIDGIRWIRVLYQNPALLDAKLRDAFFSFDRVLPYFDIPLQHVNNGILRDMRRGGSRDDFAALIASLRTGNPESVIRTSFITGFPGETDEAYAELLDFVNEIKFDRMGIFVYSEEEGTDALSLDREKVPEETAKIRREELMTAQLSISDERLSRYKGQTLDVLVEKVDTKEITGRSWHSAPEVDGYVYVTMKKDSPAAVSPGDMIRVTIDHNNEHDLYGTIA
ncbi:MAG: 30S ribosomal protein S12 methylthiotransferase RimO [Spirochaetes bacterium]|nr:30S ribosomal protein S12 methylthiotransferase RimO [Spirochaetota bacterium]